MRPIEVAKLALLAERSCEVAELAHLLAEAAARHAERVEAGDPERRHPGGVFTRNSGGGGATTRTSFLCAGSAPPSGGDSPRNFLVSGTD